jgi:flagellar biosynthesis protein FlhG
MSAAIGAHPLGGSGVPVRDQAWRLRALVESMSGARVEAAPAPTARSVPVVAIASGKGGVGKTNLAVNLCIALARRGVRPALLDADLGMANADVVCGLTPTRRLDDLLRAPEAGQSGSVLSCIVEGPGGFLLVPGAVGAARVADLDPAARARLVEQLAHLEARSDVVVIDTGAGIGRDVLAFAGASDWLVLVATPEPTSLTDAYGLVKCLFERSRRLGLTTPRVALVVSQARDRRDVESVSSRLSGCCERFLGCRPVLLGAVRADPRVGRAVRERRPHMLSRPRSPASRDIRRIGDQLAAALRLA